MSEITETTTETTEVVAANAEETIEGQEALGDPGKKALDAMKVARNAAIQKAQQAEAERDALKAQLEGREAEHSAELERQRIRDEALSAANQRILKAELKAAAKGKLADPSDASLFIDIKEFTVSDDGDVDSAALDAAISELLTLKPHLAAKQGRFDGAADQGGTRSEGQPAQITREQLKSLTPEQIVEAEAAGRLSDVMQGKA